MSEHDMDLQEAARLVQKMSETMEAEKETVAELSKQMKSVGAEMPETKAKLEKVEKAVADALEANEKLVLAQKRRDRMVTDSDGNEIDLDKKAADWAAYECGKSVQGFDAEAHNEYKAAFLEAARKAFRIEMLGEAERKALSVGTDTDGGFFVPHDMSGRIVAQQYETSPVRAYANVQTITGPHHSGYYDNDEVDSGWVAELEGRPETATPAAGRWTIPVNEMYAMPRASQNVLDDAGIDMESWLQDKIADRFTRAENTAFVSGSGSDKPRGFLTYPDGADLTKAIERIKTGVNGAFEAGADAGNSIVETTYALKSDYTGNAHWFMSRTTAAMVRKLRTTDGEFLWERSLQAGQPNQIMGYPVALFEDMPNPATGSVSIAFGDLNRAYQVVDRQGIRLLRDPFTSKPSVLFYATKRTGGDVINGEALKLIQFSA